jgi:hypothetical protein
MAGALTSDNAEASGGSLESPRGLCGTDPADSPNETIKANWQANLELRVSDDPVAKAAKGYAAGEEQ